MLQGPCGSKYNSNCEDYRIQLNEANSKMLLSHEKHPIWQIKANPGVAYLLNYGNQKILGKNANQNLEGKTRANPEQQNMLYPNKSTN